MASQEVIDKAARLLLANKVSPEDAKVYEVVGEHATYSVIIYHDDSWLCHCEAAHAELACSHGLAALKYHQGNKIPRKPRDSRQIARAALKGAKEQGVIKDFAVRKYGRATIYIQGGKFYTEHVLDTLQHLKNLGFNPNKEE